MFTVCASCRVHSFLHNLTPKDLQFSVPSSNCARKPEGLRQQLFLASHQPRMHLLLCPCFVQSKHFPHANTWCLCISVIKSAAILHNFPDNKKMSLKRHILTTTSNNLKVKTSKLFQWDNFQVFIAQQHFGLRYSDLGRDFSIEHFFLTHSPDNNIHLKLSFSPCSSFPGYYNF